VARLSDFYILGCKKDNIQSEDGMPKIWVTQLPAENYYCSPALSIDEKFVYSGTSVPSNINKTSQYFVALDAETGKEVWRLQLGINEVRSSPAVSSDNSIYFTVETHDPLNGTNQGDELWHISSEGHLIWKYDINPSKLTIDVGLSVPTIGLDGTIYVGGDKLMQLIKMDPSYGHFWANGQKLSVMHL